MSEFTDPSKAAALFSSGSANAVSFDAEAIWGVPRPIPKVCVGSFLFYIFALALLPNGKGDDEIHGCRLLESDLLRCAGGE